MSNKEFAGAMRKEAEKWIGYIPVPVETWLQIADRIERSEEPKE